MEDLGLGLVLIRFHSNFWFTYQYCDCQFRRVKDKKYHCRIWCKTVKSVRQLLPKPEGGGARQCILKPSLALHGFSQYAIRDFVFGRKKKK